MSDHISNEDLRRIREQLFAHLKPKLARVCPDNFLRDIAYETTFSEIELGTRLDLSRSDVRNIDPRDEGYEKKYQVFSLWKSRFGNGATYAVLIQALARCRPFNRSLLEFCKSAIEKEETPSPVDEAVPQATNQHVVPPLSASGVAVLVTSIASQIHISNLLLTKEIECQALEAKIRESEEEVHQLRMSNEKLKKQDTLNIEIVRKLKIENNQLRNMLEFDFQMDSTCDMSSVPAKVDVPVQANVSFASGSIADLIVPKKEEDFLPSDDSHCASSTVDYELPIKKEAHSVIAEEIDDEFPLLLSAKESLSQPCMAKKESLYCYNAGQQCSGAIPPSDRGEKELLGNRHGLTVEDVRFSMDEPAVKWPSQQSRKRSVSPNTSPVQAKVLLTSSHCTTSVVPVVDHRGQKVGDKYGCIMRGAFTPVDESAMMEWPSQQVVGHYSPDASPVQALPT